MNFDKLKIALMRDFGLDITKGENSGVRFDSESVKSLLEASQDQLAGYKLFSLVKDKFIGELNLFCKFDVSNGVFKFSDESVLEWVAAIYANSAYERAGKYDRVAGTVEFDTPLFVKHLDIRSFLDEAGMVVNDEIGVIYPKSLAKRYF